jgi:hypothetical protein
MRAIAESVALDGTALTVRLAPPLPVDGRMLSAATAIRVFERYAVIERLTIVAGAVQVSLSRTHVEDLLGAPDLAALDATQRRWQGIVRLADTLPAPGAPPP